MAPVEVAVSLPTELCEHVPACEVAWVWSFETDAGGHVSLVLECRFCRKKMSISEDVMHMAVSSPQPATVVASPEPPVLPEVQPKPFTLTPTDRKFLKSLGITSDEPAAGQ